MPTALIAAFLGAVLCELCLTHFWRFPLMRTHAARLCLWGIIAMMVPGAELAAFAGGAGAGAALQLDLPSARTPRSALCPYACRIAAAGGRDVRDRMVLIYSACGMDIIKGDEREEAR